MKPDSKVYGANMGPTWVLLSPGGPHVGPMNLAIWESDITYLSVLVCGILYLKCFVLGDNVCGISCSKQDHIDFITYWYVIEFSYKYINLQLHVLYVGYGNMITFSNMTLRK